MAEPKLPTMYLRTPEDPYGQERIEEIYGQARGLGEAALPGGGYSITGSPLWTAMFGTPGTGAPGTLAGVGRPGYLGRMGRYAEEAPWLTDAMNRIAAQYGGMMSQTRADIERQMGTYQEGTGGAQARAQQLAQAQIARERAMAQLDYAQRMHRERMYGMGAVGQQYLQAMGLGYVPGGTAYAGMQNVYAQAPGMLTDYQKWLLQSGLGGQQKQPQGGVGLGIRWPGAGAGGGPAGGGPAGGVNPAIMNPPIAGRETDEAFFYDPYAGRAIGPGEAAAAGYTSTW